jgi:ribosomal protein S18 acetylase RimI-like enzyme
MQVRAAIDHDRDALYDICVRTGDAGGDATGLIRDPALYGHLYAGAYLALEPAFASVVDLDGAVVGYVVAALDTASFEARCESLWWPPLRARHPLPASGGPLDERFVGAIHAPRITPSAVTARYPSHLHIDLLPVAQGRGVGRHLMERVFDQLREAGSSGVHLGVDRRNLRAIGFYEHLGLHRHDHDGSVLFTRRLR